MERQKTRSTAPNTAFPAQRGGCNSRQLVSRAVTPGTAGAHPAPRTLHPTPRVTLRQTPLHDNARVRYVRGCYQLQSVSVLSSAAVMLGLHTARLLRDAHCTLQRAAHCALLQRRQASSTAILRSAVPPLPIPNQAYFINFVDKQSF